MVARAAVIAAGVASSRGVRVGRCRGGHGLMAVRMFIPVHRLRCHLHGSRLLTRRMPAKGRKAARHGLERQQAHQQQDEDTTQQGGGSHD